MGLGARAKLEAYLHKAAGHHGLSHGPKGHEAFHKHITNNLEKQGREREKKKWEKYNPLRIFHPTEPFINCWNIWVVAIVMYLTWVVPVQISVWWWDYHKAIKYLGYIFDVVFMIDMTLHFRTGIYDHHGHLTFDTHHIAHHYLHGWFCFDLLATIPWAWFFEGTSAKWVKYAKLPKLMRLGTVMGLLAAHAKYMGITVVLLSIVIVGHLLATYWILTNQPCDEGVDSSADCPDAMMYYLSSLAGTYATILIGKPGGHIHTWDPDGHLSGFEVLVMLYAIPCIGFFIAELAIIVYLHDAEGRDFALESDKMWGEMKMANIDPFLTDKVMAYLQYYWSNRHRFGETKMLSDSRLPDNVRSGLAYALHHKQLEKIPFFNVLHQYEKQETCSRIQVCAYLSGDMIISKGDPGNEEMYFLNEGAAALTKDQVKNVYGSAQMTGDAEFTAILEKGTFFGEISLVCHNTRMTTIVALTQVELLIITRYAFDHNNILKRGSPFREALDKYISENCHTGWRAAYCGDHQDIGDETHTTKKHRALTHKVIKASKAVKKGGGVFNIGRHETNIAMNSDKQEDTSERALGRMFTITNQEETPQINPETGEVEGLSKEDLIEARVNLQKMITSFCEEVKEAVQDEANKALLDLPKKHPHPKAKPQCAAPTPQAATGSDERAVGATPQQNKEGYFSSWSPFGGSSSPEQNNQPQDGDAPAEKDDHAPVDSAAVGLEGDEYNVDEHYDDEELPEEPGTQSGAAASTGPSSSAAPKPKAKMAGAKTKAKAKPKAMNKKKPKAKAKAPAAHL